MKCRIKIKCCLGFHFSFSFERVCSRGAEGRGTSDGGHGRGGGTVSLLPLAPPQRGSLVRGDPDQCYQGSHGRTLRRRGSVSLMI